MTHNALNSTLTALFLFAMPSVVTVSAGGDLRSEAEGTIHRFRRADSSITTLLEKSAGYAVFPIVGKGAFIVGGEHGDGILYAEGKPIGETRLTEINVGAQVGGESFCEIIIFETPETLADFKEGHYEMSAKVSAVAAAEGAARNARYREGVIVFTLSRNGLMAQAAIGGQKFKFKPFPSSP